jgi:hypothetical protein
MAVRGRVVRALALVSAAGAPAAGVLAQSVLTAQPAAAGACNLEPVKAFGYAVGQVQCSDYEPGGTAYLQRSSNNSTWTTVASDPTPNGSGWYTPQYPCAGTYYWRTKLWTGSDTIGPGPSVKFVC